MTRHRRLGTSAYILVPVMAASALPLAAQRPTSAELSRIDSLIAADRLDPARAALEAWRTANPAGSGGIPGADRARAAVLAGRLARTWAEARDSYSSAALGYPVTDAAAEALLRLGQGLVIAAQTGQPPDAAPRAVAWLERLVSDYPNSPFRPPGYLWLARALVANGNVNAACQRLARAPAAADSQTARLIDAEKKARCGAH